MMTQNLILLCESDIAKANIENCDNLVSDVELLEEKVREHSHTIDDLSRQIVNHAKEIEELQLLLIKVKSTLARFDYIPAPKDNALYKKAVSTLVEDEITNHIVDMYLSGRIEDFDDFLLKRVDLIKLANALTKTKLKLPTFLSGRAAGALTRVGVHSAYALVYTPISHLIKIPQLGTTGRKQAKELVRLLSRELHLVKDIPNINRTVYAADNRELAKFMKDNNLATYRDFAECDTSIIAAVDNPSIYAVKVQANAWLKEFEAQERALGKE